MVSSGEKNYYLGIDLGTTNSSAAWGRVFGRKFFRPSLVPIYCRIPREGSKNKELIPSCVYFSLKGTHEIGYTAKDQLKTHPNLVVRSIKSHMGTMWKKRFNNKDFNPSEISALILRFLMKGIEKHKLKTNDIVVTVPASFDSDMRLATLEAAEAAGIKVKNPDGSIRNILLDEPRACLFDFINQQHRGDIPDSIIDFRTSKVVLVYDFGGGTLDVSIHNVKFFEESMFPEIEDLGISRYTQLGGDNFDENLAEYLFKKFIEKNDIRPEKYDPSVIYGAKSKLFSYAEEWKKRMTMNIDMELSEDNNYDIFEMSGRILILNLIDMFQFSYNLSMREYYELHAKFFAEHLKYPDSNSIQEEFNGIDLISPIIDVLKKANKKTGKILKPDLVLLSGGMTYVHLIQKRLREFFEIDPYVIRDPDKAVSRGASVYHYYLHQGYESKVITAESILIKVFQKDMKDRLHVIVPEGASLPYVKDFEFEVPKDDIVQIEIPFYRTDEQTPLLTRTFKLKYPQKKGTVIKANVIVNTLKIAEFSSWLESDPNQHLSIEINPSKPEPIIPLSDSKPMKDKKKEKTWIGSRKKIQPLDIDKIFKRVQSINKKVDYSPYTKAEIINAKNADQIIDRILKILDKRKDKSFHPNARSRLIILLGDIAKDYYIKSTFPHKLDDILNYMMKFIQKRIKSDLEVSDIHQLIRYSIETIGKVGKIDKDKKVISMFRTLLKSLLISKIKPFVITSVGKLPIDPEITELLLDLMTVSKYRITKPSEIKMIFWSVGKQGRRDVENPLPIELFKDFIEKIMIKINDSKDFEIIKYGTYALAELCYSCGSVNCVSGEKARKVISILHNRLEWIEDIMNKISSSGANYSSAKQTKKWLLLGMQILKGEEISNEQEKMFLGVREEY